MICGGRMGVSPHIRRHVGAGVLLWVRCSSRVWLHSGAPEVQQQGLNSCCWPVSLPRDGLVFKTWGGGACTDFYCCLRPTSEWQFIKYLMLQFNNGAGLAETSDLLWKNFWTPFPATLSPGESNLKTERMVKRARKKAKIELNILLGLFKTK